MGISTPKWHDADVCVVFSPENSQIIFSTNNNIVRSCKALYNCDPFIDSPEV